MNASARFTPSSAIVFRVSASRGAQLRLPQYTGSRGPWARELRLEGRDEGPALVVDRASAPEVQVVLGHLPLALLADRRAPQDVVEKRHDVVGPLGSAERHDQQRRRRRASLGS